MTTLDLPRMRDQYRKDLFDDYLPFHERFVNDKKFGGFLCSVRPNGELVSDEKRVWFEGRGVWVYSFLYNHLAREQKYLDTAAASVRLLSRTDLTIPKNSGLRHYTETAHRRDLRIQKSTAICSLPKGWRNSLERPGIASTGTRRARSC